MDGDVLYSKEGTTQGDPLAMAMYAIATIPLINKLNGKVCQTWYADDATATGSINHLRNWWDKIVSEGPKYGYHANASKSWLITKKSFFTKAIDAFENTSVKVTSEGRPHLGAPLGTPEYIKKFVISKVSEWSEEIELLSKIAKTQPHAAHAVLTHGLCSKWRYLSRVTPDICALIHPLEEIIRTRFAPNLTNQPPFNDNERDLLSLPARLGGIALTNPLKDSDSQFLASLKVTEPLKKAILSQVPDYTYEIMSEQMKAKAEVHNLNCAKSSTEASRIKQFLPDNLKRAMDHASEKGASSWLTTLPIDEYGFALHKGAFHDALALRYGWQFSYLPTNCDCGKKFSIEHSLSCPRGGFPIIRHNEIRDVTANLLSEVCKKRAYEQRVREIEHASFTPLVLSATGGFAREATIFYKRLASLLATKWDSNSI